MFFSVDFTTLLEIPPSSWKRGSNTLAISAGVMESFKNANFSLTS